MLLRNAEQRSQDETSNTANGHALVPPESNLATGSPLHGDRRTVTMALVWRTFGSWYGKLFSISDGRQNQVPSPLGNGRPLIGQQDRSRPSGRHGQLAAPINGLSQAERFVRVLTELVKTDMIRKEQEQAIKKHQEADKKLQYQFDVASWSLYALEQKRIPEIESVLQEQEQTMNESQMGIGMIRQELADREHSHAATMRARKRLLQEMYDSAQRVVDEARPSGMIAGLTVDFEFCYTLVGLRQRYLSLKDNEQLLRLAQREYLDSGDKSISARKELAAARLRARAAAMSTVNAAAAHGPGKLVAARIQQGGQQREASAQQRLRRAQDARAVARHKLHSIEACLMVERDTQAEEETAFLSGPAYNVLVAADRLPIPRSPSGTPSNSLVGNDDIQPTMNLAKELDYPTSTAHRKLLDQLGEARRIARDERATLIELRQVYGNLLARHMQTYTDGSKDNFDPVYRTRMGRSFVELEAEYSRDADNAERAYERAREAVFAAGIEDVPLSPASLAARTDDSSDSVSADPKEWLPASSRRRRIRRWARRVARHRSVELEKEVSEFPLDFPELPDSDEDSQTAYHRQRRAGWRVRHERTKRSIRRAASERWRRTGSDRGDTAKDYARDPAVFGGIGPVGVSLVAPLSPMGPFTHGAVSIEAYLE